MHSFKQFQKGKPEQQDDSNTRFPHQQTQIKFMKTLEKNQNYGKVQIKGSLDSLHNEKNGECGTDLKIKTGQKDKTEYRYYGIQTKDEYGKFDMRFESIKNSPINEAALTQLRHASSFQFNKTFKHLFSKGKNVVQIQKEQNFVARQNQIKMTWMGHASVLLSICGDVHILIDPIFSNRVVDFIGQKRTVAPPCQISDLPKIDFVLISHDHYDHCNMPSIKELVKKQQKDQFFLLIGRNSASLFSKVTNTKIKEMSWTQSQQFVIRGTQIKITFVPACHWSKRSLSDQNQRLWGGFVIETLGKKIYFAGDTGYCGLFKQLHHVFQGFDLSLLPIGAYEPNEFLKAQHINPREAVDIHNQIKSKLSVGIHWGTFPMSHQTPEQVLHDFNIAIDAVEQGQFKVVKIGGSVSLHCCADRQLKEKI